MNLAEQVQRCMLKAVSYTHLTLPTILRRDRARMNLATEPDLHFLWAYAQAAPPFAVCEGSTGFLLRVRSMDKSDGPMLRAAYEPV